MAFWFLEDIPRLSHERAAIADLTRTSDWLVEAQWDWSQRELAVNAIIHVHGHDYQVRLIYPEYFPASPPIVRPVNADSRWSNHQYGDATGPLCLEWGPDNWQPAITGAQVLESAYRLLGIENPLGDSAATVRITAPSRHFLTPGQELRFTMLRFYVSTTLRRYVTELPEYSTVQMKFTFAFRRTGIMGFIFQASVPNSDDIWHDTSLPATMKGSSGDEGLSSGVLYKTQLSTASLRDVSRYSQLATLLGTNGFDTEVIAQTDPKGLLVVDEANVLHFYLTFGDDTMLYCTAVESEDTRDASRQPTAIQKLSEKKIGIVGLGSVGSKIAETLARMGVGALLLVDHDVLLPENLVRHALDWRNIGDHKVEGTKDLIERITPLTRVTVSAIHLTGQESTAVVDGVLRDLGGCDLLIDATADPRVFNLLALVAQREEKPLVWTEVYGGGNGGMMGRSRPGQDALPHTIKCAYLAYCEEHPAPEATIKAPYTSETDTGDVLMASDADVSLIALHTARFAVDTVLNNTTYPYSLYLMGLGSWWVFSQPFDTIPIETRHLSEPAPASPPDEATLQSTVEFLSNLLSRADNGSDSSP